MRYESAGCLLLSFNLERRRLHTATLDFAELATILREAKGDIFRNEEEKAADVMQAVDKVQEVWSRWEVAFYASPFFIADMKSMLYLPECLGMPSVAKSMRKLFCDVDENDTGLHMPPRNKSAKQKSLQQATKVGLFVPRQNIITPAWKH